MLDKNKLCSEFQKNWEKHYNLNILKERGFSRQRCKNCRKSFWAYEKRERCGDATCIGYEFIGNPPSNKKLTYIETWDLIKKYFTSHNHGYVAPYPTVARWRDDLYFTMASISNFQPYVVNGELEPPANPLIVPQACIRFNDIENVGITGRHYTNFVMIGQHAFNTEKTGLFYWKDKALEHDMGYLKALGIEQEDLVFTEDVWVGGGNYGPCMEYFSQGLELGNCVFMQYKTTKTGTEELKTKVIDMGAGLARLAWITHGSPTSYEIVFGDVIKEMKKDFDVHIDEALFSKYVKLAGSLTLDEVSNIENEKIKIARQLGLNKKTLFDRLEPLQALYATADHLCTALFITTDGMLPSNSGGGYNLRLILRRVFGFEERNKWEFDFEKILKAHAKHLYPIFPNLKQGVESVSTVIEEEQKKFLATKEKSKAKVISILKNRKRIEFEDLKTLYISQGIPPEYIVKVGMENNIQIDVPGNFYDRIRVEDEVSETAKPEIEAEVDSFQKTELLFYSEKQIFEAKVLGVLEEKYLILNRTAFYPESGGQVGDSGTINGIKVKNTKKAGNVVLHEIENVQFKTGQKVKGIVDLKRRKDISKNHSAAHLLNAASRIVLGNHVWQTGSYKDENKAHLDITHYKTISQKEVNEIEKKVNEWIMENLPINIIVLQRNIAEKKYGFRLYQGGAIPGKELRIVEIGAVDAQACGGTHNMNKTTGELGFFKIIKTEGIQDGIQRINYKTGLGALKHIQNQEEILRMSCANLSVSETELPKTTKRFFEEWKERGKKIERLLEANSEQEAQKLIAETEKTKSYVFKILDVDSRALMKIAQKITQQEQGAVALLNKNNDLICACGKKSELKANEILNELIKKYGGKGGGNEQIAIGKTKISNEK